MIAPVSNWAPNHFLRHERSYATSRKIALIVTDAGKAYIKTMCKTLSPHPLACELVGTHLARWFGLPTLDFAIMNVKEDDQIPLDDHGMEFAQPGPAFVTRQVASATPWSGVGNDLDRIENNDIITKLVVFDTWTLNWDRCPAEGDSHTRENYDNVLLTSEGASPGNWRMLVIDHTECFSGGRDLSPRLKTIGRVRDEKIYGVFQPFKRYIWRASVEEAAARLRVIREDTVREYVECIPLEWEVNEAMREALVQFVYRRATFLADNIVRLLSSGKYTDWLC